MSHKLKKLIGLKKTEFDDFIKSGEIHLSQARLIPMFKVGDELSLTSIFLSSLQLVKEFKTTIFSELKLPLSGKIYCYTEATFKNIDSNSRIDGLLIIVVSGVIKDAVFFEMKNKNKELEAEQITKYMALAKNLEVSKLVTVSNQFVANSSHSPLKIKVPKNIALSHFSWTYIKTIAQLLIYKNEQNIEGEDQVKIMSEVLSYLESPLSGVCGYNKMKNGWSETVKNINWDIKLSESDSNVEDAVVSWHEEEKDLSLVLSKELATRVKSAYPKKKLKERLKADISALVKSKKLKCSLVVKRAVSNIDIVADLKSRTISMSIKLIPPLDKGIKGRIGWLKRQLEDCNKKQNKLFIDSKNELFIEANIKFTQKNIKIPYTDIEEIYNTTKNKDIIDFKITQIKSLGTDFSKTQKFIIILESMLIDYYICYVQNLKNWSRSVPKIETEQSDIINI